MKSTVKFQIMNVVVLIVAPLLVLLTHFQSCAPQSFQAEVNLLSLQAQSPDQIQGLHVWEKLNQSPAPYPSQGAFIGEAWSLVAVVKAPTKSGTFFRLDDRTLGNEGIFLRYQGQPLSLMGAMGVSSQIRTNFDFPLSASSYHVLVIQSPRLIQNTQFYLDGEKKSLNLTPVVQMNWSYIARYVQAALDSSFIVEYALFKRALTGYESATLVQRWAMDYNLSIPLGQFSDVQDESSLSIPQYAKDVRPIFAAHNCFSCHPGVQPDLTSYTPLKISQSVLSQAMPPQGSPPLTNSEKEIVARWATMGAGF